MSLASSPDSKFWPEEKSLKMLFPTNEDTVNDSFDQYLNHQFYDLSDDDQDKDHLADFVDLLDAEAQCNSRRSKSPTDSFASREKSPTQPWRKGLWCLGQPEESSPRSKVRERRNSATTAHDATFDFRAKTSIHDLDPSLCPRSPPESPSHMSTKQFATSSRNSAVRHRPYGLKSYSREATLSPSPMYARVQYTDNIAYLDWQRDFQDFNLRTREQSLPLSPPQSDRHFQQKALRRAKTSDGPHDFASVENALARSPRHDRDCVLPSVEGPYGGPDAESSSSAFTSRGMVIVPRNTKYGPVSPDRRSQSHYQEDATWTPEDVYSPTESERLHYCEPHAESRDEGQAWRSSAAAIASLPQLPHHDLDFCTEIAAPTPHRPTHQLLKRSSGLERGGLMIDYPEPEANEPARARQAFSVSPPPLPNDAPQCACSTNVITNSAYPPVPEHHSASYEPFSETSPFTTTTSRMRHPISSPQPSPTTSPPSRHIPPPPHHHHQASPTRSTRRRSMPGKPTSAITKPPRGPRRPKTPNSNSNGAGGGGGGGFDFVNLTPKDSQKLLSDVAPSGSSKTRARREYEAMEKRRRLGEAAVRAVRKAGGDVKALEKAIMA